ncbi:hypothetical protein [Desulfonatronum lacustre]|uniref:hypothetical protein n=1 Tax=Desulfonatronum lacustre TaxID=66849 RepID=UPI00048E1186|nr:hypothetical protein [Desulfonatronum lacustre]SMP46300.1 hypothetical protein SAMN06295888_10410 [Desulfonatronum zhilinae]
MSHLEQMADELATEVISEAAQTFFGQRKALEEEMDRFTARSRQVLELGKRVMDEQNVLHGVLLDAETIQAFYAVLGHPAPEHPSPAPREEIARRLSKPTAWTLHGRYSKLLFSAYSRTHAEVDVYLHGGYRDDPTNPKRKIAFSGYLKMVEWAEKLNHTITKLNTEQSAGEVLQFVKRLDARSCSMEKAAGASCEIGRDRGMLFTCIDFASLCLPVFPEYPPPDTVQKTIRQFAKTTCARRESDVRELLRDLKNTGA